MGMVINGQSPAEVTLGDTLIFTITTHTPGTGALTDADSAPAYRVYEDTTSVAIATGTMSKFDDDNTLGFYRAALLCDAASGYQVDKTYTIYIEATVGGVKGGQAYGFKCKYDLDTDVLSLVNLLDGPGDYEVTLTVRTTAGTAISGVSVWLNTSADRSSAVAGPLITDDSGEVTFNLSYTTYYVYCHLAGYSFAETSFTAAAGSVDFTLDIGTALTLGSASNYTDSFLTTMITSVRESIDEPSINAKYSDDRLITLAEKSYDIVLGEIQRNSREPVVAQFNVTVASGTTKYNLPTHKGAIIAIYQATDSGAKYFYNSRSSQNPLGQYVWVAGNTLHIQSDGTLDVGTVITVEYTPSGLARLHNGICTVDAAGDTVTLAAAPFQGALDTHDEGYTGMVLRILKVTGTSPTGNYMQERIITSYDNTTRAAELELALDPIPAAGVGGSIFYEIAPAVSKGIEHVIALYTAYHICNVEGNMKRASGLLKEYRQSMRNLRLNAFYSNIAEAGRVPADNLMNRRYRRR